jgi:hypothetical protein
MKLASDGEVGSVAVPADHKAALAFAVEFCRMGEVLLGASLNPELPLFGKLERGRTCKDLGIVLGS